ncbi:hypothetical protein AVL62_05700 [Serinicoccus chungangensis]|uniref:Uncharacterized protein n=1 Tax=Serinicoccus chungangensis TaxID=767452 RepID=A0A0W8I8Z6_9MICO|nr:hypothetical protein [Serinicoccus chungangensis]KUG55781.1 hypothetical protein AVL62_05700 [Serinicoccus chungangensis]
MTEAREDIDEVTALLDRAGGHAPPLHVSREDVVRRGSTIRRGRRVAAAVSTLAVAGVLWFGWAVAPLGEDPVTAPAEVTWSDLDLDGRLLGLSGRGSSTWSAELRTVEGQEQPELVVSRDGEVLPEPLQAQDGPGEVQVFRTDGLTVAVWLHTEDDPGGPVAWGGRCSLCVGGASDVDGTRIGYAATAAVGSADPAELYVMTEGAVTTLDGRGVPSLELAVEERRFLVFLDEQAGLWGVRGPDDGDQVEVMPVHGDAGTIRGGERSAPWLVSLIPPVAEAVLGEGSVEGASTELAGHQVLIGVGDQTEAPEVDVVIDGERRSLDSYVDSQAREVGVGEPPVTWRSTVEGFLWLDQGSKTEALSVREELSDGRAVVVPVAGGTLVVVGGWAPAPEEAAVFVGDGGGGRWEAATSVRVRELADGRPVTFLGLPVLSASEQEQVVDVGVADEDPSDPEPLGLEEIQVVPLGD